MRIGIITTAWIIAWICWPTGAIANIVDEPTRWYVAIDGNDANAGGAKDPFASIDRARRAVREWLAQGGATNVEVLIAEGVYELHEPLQFIAADAAPAGKTITYASLPGEKVTISGGACISQWEKSGELWEAAVDSERLHRQLFIDDERAVRAREPDEGYFRVSQAGADGRTRLFFDPAEWSSPAFAPEMELVLLHDWSASRVTVAAVEPTSHEIVLVDPIGASHEFFRIDGFEPHPRFFLEHAATFIDEPGEYFHDRQSAKLLLKLAPDDSPDSHEFRIARLPNLITIVGEPNKPVRGLHFRGIRFAHTACPIPAGGCAEVQAGFFQSRAAANAENSSADPNAEVGNRRLPAAIELRFATDCAIQQCSLVQLGGGGVYLEEECRSNRIEECDLDDVGACGVMIGETASRAGPQGEALNSSDNVVSRNRISRCGAVLPGSVGVWIGIASATLVKENEISDLPYTGVSVGWRWDATPTGCGGNRIVGNEIHDVMQLLSDGGGIYTLGRQPGTLLQSNRIYNVPLNAGRAESNGIFMDEGSSQIEVSDNVIYSVARSPIRFHKALDNTLSRNQLFTTPGGAPFTYNSTDPATMTFIDNQIAEGTPELK